MATKQVLVIGGGVTGCAIAHDLTLRGVEVTVVERGELASGTTGRCSAFLHSGSRYAVTDPEAADECIAENQIMRKVMPSGMIEPDDGLFILLKGDDPAYADQWFQGCADAGITAKEISPAEVARREPLVTREISRAAITPDAVIEALRFALVFAATARVNGAHFLPYSEVQDFLMDADRVIGLKLKNRVTGELFELRGDAVINAAGPWVGEISSLIGIRIPLSMSPGVHVIIGKRLVNHTINLIRKPASGDFAYPQGPQTILGTTSWTVENCDHLRAPKEHITNTLRDGEVIIPSLRKYPVLSVNAATRPLIAKPGANERELSRKFEVFDHAEINGVESFVTIGGGKLTIARAMAEKTCDVVCKKLGVDAPCRTASTPMVSWRRFYVG
ncbi:MAG: FAD-dependent oxidoreductase [Candidatus Dormibacteria bacterium]|jgi:glycerol-3-phosphate dehydrogenase